MKKLWTYEERQLPDSPILWEVLENGRRLTVVYRAATKENDKWSRVDRWSRFVWDGLYAGMEIRLNPFQFRIGEYDPNLDDVVLNAVVGPSPLPVFVCQEEEIKPITFGSPHPVFDQQDDRNEWLLYAIEENPFGPVIKDALFIKLPMGTACVYNETLA